MRLEQVLERVVDYRLRPRYAETDQMGVIYYAHYLVWFECARTEWLRQTGRTYARMEEEGVFLPVRRCAIEYHEGARYDRPLVVRTRVAALTPVRVKFRYEVEDEETGRRLADGATEHAFVERGGRLSRRGFEALGVEPPE